MITRGLVPYARVISSRQRIGLVQGFRYTWAPRVTRRCVRLGTCNPVASPASVTAAGSVTSTRRPSTSPSTDPASRCSLGSFRPGFQIRSMNVASTRTRAENASAATMKMTPDRNTPAPAEVDGSTTAATARNGSKASAKAIPPIVRSGSRKPIVSIPASPRTSVRTVRASDWKVRSRPSATKRPSDPPASPAAAVTPTTSRTWPLETPPSSMQRKKTGAAAARSVTIWSRLAASLPRMISTSRKSVINKRMNVRRSFSWATAVAAERGAKKSIKVSWKRTNRRNSRWPKWAMIPTSDTSANPTSDCQAVHIRMNKRPM